ncbi:MAG: hypothetical protein ACREOZ_01035, partial [Gloeomargaritales cyanobacterium]
SVHLLDIRIPGHQCTCRPTQFIKVSHPMCRIKYHRVTASLRNHSWSNRPRVGTLNYLRGLPKEDG